MNDFHFNADSRNANFKIFHVKQKGDRAAALVLHIIESLRIY